MSSVETKQKPKFISKFKPLADIRPLIEEGDLLEIQEANFTRWAVYVGNQEAIHYTMYQVKKSRLDDVIRDSFCRINNSNDSLDGWKPYEPNIIAERARSRLGERGFNALQCNCEQLANYCRYGKHFSFQIDTKCTQAKRLKRILDEVLETILWLTFGLVIWMSTY